MALICDGPLRGGFPMTAGHVSLTAGHVSLTAVLCTEQPNRRSRRLPDYEKVDLGLLALMQALWDASSKILQSVSDTLLYIIGASSAGVSLLTEDGKRFHWPAISGSWRSHIGAVLDRNTPLLFTHWDRRYPYMIAVEPYARDALVAPFISGGKAVGTIWIIAHDNRRKFDLEDLRLLESFGRFAGGPIRLDRHRIDERKTIA